MKDLNRLLQWLVAAAVLPVLYAVILTVYPAVLVLLGREVAGEIFGQAWLIATIKICLIPPAYLVPAAWFDYVLARMGC